MDILNHHLTIGTNTGKISPRAKAHITRGDVAQLGEHHVRNVGVVGSNPIISTTETKSDRKLSLSVRFVWLIGQKMCLNTRIPAVQYP